jgi:acetyl esterase
VRFALDGLLAEVPAAQIDEARASYTARPVGRGPSTLEQLHDLRARRAAPTPVDPPAIEEIAEAEGARVAVRIFCPTGSTSRGVYLDIHGGGFYMDSAARSDVRNRQLADSLEMAVVSVDYRLAPEHSWPAPSDDCATAGLWLLEEAETRFGTSRLAIGGSSAGATLAMTTLLRLRDRGVVDGFVGAALQFGTYDLSAQTPAGRRIADEFGRALARLRQRRVVRRRRGRGAGLGRAHRVHGNDSTGRASCSESRVHLRIRQPITYWNSPL